MNVYFYEQEESPPINYDGYEDPEVDEFDSVKLVYREDDGMLTQFIFYDLNPTKISCFVTFSDYNGVNPANGPCSDYKPGEDDLQAFDFIRKFR